MNRNTCVIGFEDCDWNCQLISKAKELAGNGEVTAVILSPCNKDEIKRYERCGASKLRIYHQWSYSSESAAALAQILRDTGQPKLYMICAQARGVEIASRMSVVLGCGLVAECIGIDEEEQLVFTRTTNSASNLARITCINSMASMCTVKRNIFEIKEEYETTASVGYFEQILDFTSEGKQPKVLAMHELPVMKSVNLKNARIILGLGRGAANDESISNANKIAAVLGAQIGVTRTLVEHDLFGKEHQIGQSGEVANPDIYIAFGISGAIQHMVGIEKAHTIIAVNRDKNAPIFEYANYCIVDDCNMVLKKMAEQLEEDDDGYQTDVIAGISKVQ